MNQYIKSTFSTALLAACVTCGSIAAGGATTGTVSEVLGTGFTIDTNASRSNRSAKQHDKASEAVRVYPEVLQRLKEEQLESEKLRRQSLFGRHLAEQALGAGKLDIAEAEYRKILGSSPDDVYALRGLARVRSQRAREVGHFAPGLGRVRLPLTPGPTQ